MLWNSTNCYNNHGESCTEVIGWHVNAMLKKKKKAKKKKKKRQKDLNYMSKEMKTQLNKKQMLHAVY